MDTVREVILNDIKKYDDLSKPGREIELMCELFLRKDCTGCPVRGFACERECKGTPYNPLPGARHAAHVEMIPADATAFISEAKKATKEMADFLRDVLEHYDRIKGN